VAPLSDSPRLQIVSTPPGVPFKLLASDYQSSIAGVLRSGETPATIDDLSPGSYRVIFSPAGSPSMSNSVRLPTSGTARCEQVLPHGVVKVRSQPTGAEVVCDGRDLGPAPMELPLLSGRHALTARWNGREARIYTINLADSAEETVIFDFPSGSSPSATSATRTRPHHARKKEEDPSVLEKVGRSLKNLFTGDSGKKK
jgi:hypothetical protein